MTPQQTSIEAYNEIINELGNRQSEVYNTLKKLGSANNRIISNEMQKPTNTITPRIKELRDKKLVGVDKVAIDSKTGRKTIFWRIVR